LSAAKPITDRRSGELYRRTFLAGGTYFFTVNLAERRGALLTEHIGLLRSAFRSVRTRHPFAIEAAVILPDHLHMIWTLPEGDAAFATRWRLVKSAFSHGLPRSEAISASRIAKGERGIWQRRYWEHALRDEDDFLRHVDYIHFNPVKHGHAARVQDGHIPRFTAGSGLALIRKTGRAMPARKRAPLGNDDGFRSAQPIPPLDSVERATSVFGYCRMRSNGLQVWKIRHVVVP
jgi:REP-associated tyrosine transposase